MSDWRDRAALWRARWIEKPVLWAITSPRLLRLLFAATAPVRGTWPAGVTRSRATLGGQPCLRLTPKGARGRLLYLHGGGFVVGRPISHGRLAAHVAAASGREVWLTDYRLAPEHPFPAAIDDAEAAYAALSARGPVAVMGDSAGGGLALSLLHACGPDALPVPEALVLLSPVADLSEGRGFGPDQLLPHRWAEASVRAYAGDRVPDGPRFNPLAAPFPAAPPTLIQLATGEALEGDGHAAAEALRAAGAAPVTVEATPDSYHVWHMGAGRMPMADRAVARIGAFLRAHGA